MRYYECKARANSNTLFINTLQNTLKGKCNTLHTQGRHSGTRVETARSATVVESLLRGLCPLGYNFSAVLRDNMSYSFRSRSFRTGLPVVAVLLLAILPALAQTDCALGDSPVNSDPPKNISVQDLIQRFTANENKVRDARSHYTYTQDVLARTLDEKSVTGQFHQITRISYDDKGKRVENVTFSEQSTLRDIQLSAEDFDDIRVFMQWIFTSDELPQYTVGYSGQQHVDDIDTYVFHVEPKTQEKNRRYFQGRIWVDARDLQIAKLCGKSVPDMVRPKKHQPLDIRPTFVGYRQIVDGNWFPVYAKVDDTLQFGTSSIHIREIVKFSDYKRSNPATGTAKP